MFEYKKTKLKMKILIIGFSSIVNRRVLPAVIKNKDIIEKISIGSKSLKSLEVIPKKIRGELYQNYEEALTFSDCDIVYISLPNSLHFKYAQKALINGHHVIIDKPAVMNNDEAVALKDLSSKKSLCLAEANVWKNHRQAKFIKKFIKENGNPLHISMLFTSPALESSNFRYDSRYGSGIIYDRASYVISCGKFFFEKSPKNIHGFINKNDMKNNTDISSSIFLTYSNGAVLSSFLSLEAEYKNEIICLGSDYIISSERVFTPPPELDLTIKINKKNKINITRIESDDSFANFIREIIQSINSNNFNKFSDELVESSLIMDKIFEKVN